MENSTTAKFDDPADPEKQEEREFYTMVLKIWEGPPQTFAIFRSVFRLGAKEFNRVAMKKFPEEHMFNIQSVQHTSANTDRTQRCIQYSGISGLENIPLVMNYVAEWSSSRTDQDAYLNGRNPESFEDGIIILSMFNDIGSTKRHRDLFAQRQTSGSMCGKIQAKTLVLPGACVRRDVVELTSQQPPKTLGQCGIANG